MLVLKRELLETVTIKVPASSVERDIIVSVVGLGMTADRDIEIHRDNAHKTVPNIERSRLQ